MVFCSHSEFPTIYDEYTCMNTGDNKNIKFHLCRSVPSLMVLHISFHQGIFVSRVAAGEPAEKAGLQVGDKLLEVRH